MRYRSRVLATMLLVAYSIIAPGRPAVGLDDVGLPIHPKAIASSVVQRTGKGEGTQWVQVNFKTTAPYEQVVRFYREKAGPNVHISRLDSGKLLNTFIMFAEKPQDQINVNISSQVGRRGTEVEIFRNLIAP